MTVFQVASADVAHSVGTALRSLASAPRRRSVWLSLGRAVAMGGNRLVTVKARHPLLRALGLESLDDGTSTTVEESRRASVRLSISRSPRRHADSSRPACLHACHGGRRSPLCTRRCADSIRTRHRNGWPHVCDRACTVTEVVAGRRQQSRGLPNGREASYPCTPIP